MVIANRKKIGLIYSYSENWIAGSYYIQNIIKSVKLISDDQKPQFIIFHKKDTDISEIISIGYPFLTFIVLPTLSLIERAINKISYRLFQKAPIRRHDYSEILENIYIFNGLLWRIPEMNNIKNKVLWIGDFQEEYLPELFSKSKISERRRQNNKISKTQLKIAFSSYSCLDDYNKFYPQNSNVLRVLQFCSILPSYNEISLSELLKKYSIESKYFILPNQLWKHKNHIVVLEAAKILKNSGVEFQIIFTGKEYDFRNPTHHIDIKEFILKNNLTNNIKLLGFIDRRDQLKLMLDSIAIIQPSLFEGWNTSVEDAKNLNKFTILSDIPVHKEQMVENCIFFNPSDESELASILKSYIIHPPKTVELDYTNKITQFAQNFIELF
jgi:glycosyltransferase involved in cell wall biosynthesis